MSNLRVHIPFTGFRNSCDFGFVPNYTEPKPHPGRIFAFALADGSKPRVFDFEAGEEGMKAVANLVRTEDVLAVVRGHRMNVQRFSVVSFSVCGDKHEDKLLLSDGDE